MTPPWVPGHGPHAVRAFVRVLSQRGEGEGRGGKAFRYSLFLLPGSLGARGDLLLGAAAAAAAAAKGVGSRARCMSTS